MRPQRLGYRWQERPRRRLQRLWGLALIGAVACMAFLLWPKAPGPEPALSRKIENLDLPGGEGADLNRSRLPGWNEEEGAAEEVAPELPSDPFHLTGKVQRNQTLFVTLRNRGLAPSRIQPVIDAMSTVFDFRRAHPGDAYEVRLDIDGNVLEFRYQTSPEDVYVARLVGDAYQAEKVEIPKETRLERIQGTIATSLYKAFTDLGERGEIAMAFMDLFVFDFDFGANARPGDRFTLIAEKIYLDGRFYKYGRIWAAQYQSTGLTLDAYWFEQDASGEYYDGDGRALRRFFIKAPVLNCKITSPFSLRRYHPVLKRYRPHYGVDWAGPTGTPVMSVADGVVSFIGWKGGNGNLLVIDHPHGYVTLYAHLKGFAAGLKKGSKVKQRQVVAYLGNTGISTGPHLHFGMKKDGVYVDPLEVDNTRLEQLSGARLSRFKAEKERLARLLDEGMVNTSSESEVEDAAEVVAPSL